MSKKIDVWADLTPEDLIEKMYERTDADGVLYMPSFFTVDKHEDEESLRCVMNWEYPNDCFSVLQEFDQLRSALEQIAERGDRYGLLDEDDYAALTAAQKEVFDTYLCGFASDDDFDTERIYAISESLDTVAFIRELCAEIISGKELSEGSADYLRDFMKERVSEEDKAYYQRFQKARDQEARRRIGDSPFAYLFVMHAWRYFRLLGLKAPDIIVNNEAKSLASALTLFRWCRKYEYVDNAVRLHYDRRELMSDEELDALSRPRNANSRKSMVPLFVYLILKQHSSSEHPLKQHEIISYLADEPYEVVIERKALSRVIHNLKDSQLGIYTDKHRGTWHMGGQPEET